MASPGGTGRLVLIHSALGVLGRGGLGVLVPAERSVQTEPERTSATGHATQPFEVVHTQTERPVQGTIPAVFTTTAWGPYAAGPPANIYQGTPPPSGVPLMGAGP